jgi:Rad3-related DNA helicase
MDEYRVSVRELVEDVLRRGDINSGPGVGSSMARMNEGSLIHRMLQDDYSKHDLREVMVSQTHEKDGLLLKVSGRIDGVLGYDSELPVIEEIKSTLSDITRFEEPFEVHLAQGMVYAFFYADQFGLAKIGVSVRYFSAINESEKRFNYEYSIEELREYFISLSEVYIDRLLYRAALTNRRNDSIKGLPFPFEYRPNQRKTIVKLYRAIGEGKNVFMAAPTGSGKTVNTLFASVLRLADYSDSRVFYLTGRSTQKQVALSTVQLLSEKGLKCLVTEITAKEKCCFTEEKACTPEMCPYTIGYYTRLYEMLREATEETTLFTAEFISQFCEMHKLCPFEFSLDLAQFSDIIICDYNYAFDPFVRLFRFFDEEVTKAKQMHNILLIDEAHNLIDRANSMYSGTLSKKKVLIAKKAAKGIKGLTKSLKRMNDALLEFKKRPKDETFSELSDELVSELFIFLSEASDALSPPSDITGDEIIDLFFDVRRFARLYQMKGESHRFFYDHSEDEIVCFCCDAKAYLKASLEVGSVSAVFFSATLHPIGYYCERLGGRNEDYLMDEPGIFDPENLKVLVDKSVTSLYRKREGNYEKIARRIDAILNAGFGNSMVFFPSYDFMDKVKQHLRTDEECLLIQERKMSEADRTAFLEAFEEDGQVKAFAVAGGVFSEGIDLVGSRLKVVVVVGVSLPMVNLKQKLISDYFAGQGKNGFLYAYLYQGMNRVLQAMGRVLRTQTDKGMVVLLDERFGYSDYRVCFPKYYEGQLRFVDGQEALEGEMESVRDLI